MNHSLQPRDPRIDAFFIAAFCLGAALILNVIPRL